MSAATFRLLPRPADKCGAWIADRAARAFAALGFAPNVITLLGLASSCGAGYFLAFGRPFGAGLMIVVSGVLDMLDGRVARLTGRPTRFGAMLDSSLDRYSEFALYGGLAYHFRGRWPETLAALAFLGSVMVSYTRARAEGLGFECRKGLMQRAERLIALGLACLAACIFPVYDAAMIAALALIASASHITAVQRLWLVRRAERSGGEDAGHAER
ncbi:MAG: CDP-alcohol phosphatidyltransferase family protein [Candidatus Aminicenantales bacterium]